MDASVSFRDYRDRDRPACMGLFDANCPAFFAPNEREDYAGFLRRCLPGYRVCERAGRVVGAWGRFGGDLNWILLDPSAQGLGIGSAIIDEVVDAARAAGLDTLRIAASHRSAPFFARFGAQAVAETVDGWGPGMHRIDMRLAL